MFLNFSETKKFSTESFLASRELQPLVSYKRVSYKKIRVITNQLSMEQGLNFTRSSHLFREQPLEKDSRK